MGLGGQRSFLPTATDSAIESAEERPIEHDLGTDLSKRTDRSFQVLPESGIPVNLPSQSQTSLLIEYFEGPDKKQGVRYKVTPSTTRREAGHSIVAPKLVGGGLPKEHHFINDSMSAVDSELPMPRSRGPMKIDVYNGSEISTFSEPPDARYVMPGSDVSSMPGDSVLGATRPVIMTQHAPSDSINRSEISEISEISEKENLKPPIIPSSSNKSRERLASRAIEIITNRPHANIRKSSLSEHSRSRSSVSREVDLPESRRRIAKNIEDDSVTGTASSMISGSALSAQPRSVKSGTSAGSVTNPKLLQTVEDAIRRLILPELKEIKNEQKHTTHAKRHKLAPSDSFDSSSVSREETTRRRSSGSKTKRRSTGSREHGQRVSSGSRRHNKTVEYDSPSEQSYRESVDSTSVDGDRKSRKHKSHRARDAAAGALIGGALTAAALKHHESGSSLDHRERRKKRSKSRSSRSASVAESEEIFQKHAVPPMPMRSDLGSELTRSSILSSNTNGTLTPTRREVREVVRGSPNELLSPSSQTPSRTPVEKPGPNTKLGIQRGLGTRHGNLSERDLSAHREIDEEDELTEGASPDFARDGFDALGPVLLTDPERAELYERNLHTQHPIRRGLSPIQSVASYATTEANRNSMIQPKSKESLSSEPKEDGLKDQISIASLSSAPSTDLAKSRRPHGLSLENRSEIMHVHKDAGQGAARELDTEEFYADQHSQNDHYRNSFESDSHMPTQRFSHITDESVDGPYIDKVTAGQNLAFASGATPEYVHLPTGVESAVASLYEPSMLGSRGNFSPTRSNLSGSVDQYDAGSQHSMAREFKAPYTGSPLKQRVSYHSQDSLRKEAALSPIQSVTASPPPAEVLVDEKVAEPVPVVESQDAASPESEITTNPSVIQGPIAGYEHGSRDHWPYGPTPPPTKGDVLAANTRNIGLTGPPDLVPEALSINHAPVSMPEGKRTLHIGGPPMQTTPPGMITDEGYDTGVPNAPSPLPIPKERAMPPVESFSPGLPMDDPMDEEDDPFIQKKNQYISGLSQGMSPLYDSATGKGIDRIQSKDVVALMDHLTVRDAQRNARDTEILVTLVRTAAEMRNSFEDMRKFVTEQGDVIMDTADKQHQHTQKAIGGTRPPPPAASARFARSTTSEEEDMPTKQRNIFKRAVRGLGTKNTAELRNIEAMLMQLLDDVEGLRGLQPGAVGSNEPRMASFASADNAQLPTDPGYEPEGQAGTSSTGGRSGIFSNNSSRQANYQTVGRQGSGNRVSTVMEGDEEYEDQMMDQAEQTTPKASFARGVSEPLHTPPRMPAANQGSMSNDNTPHYSTESSGRKHKSFASWLLPKAASRWSKTTASSTGEHRASTLTKPRPYSQVSQSGSHLEEYDYDHQGDDRLRSNASLQDEQYQSENRPPSPLVPSQVSENHPKYQAHRNSVNLQHPQPRQGPTGRFQHHLESEARYYNNEEGPISPSSVTSSQWEAQAGVTAMPSAPNDAYTHGGHLSPISDGGYSETSAAMMDRDGYRQPSVRSDRSASNGPQRPPKIPMDEPLVPQRPPKLPMSPSGARQPVSYVDQVAAARAGSPAVDKSPVAALRHGGSPSQSRKPSGPRPLSGGGQYGAGSGQYATNKGRQGDVGALKKTRFRGSPYHIDSEEEA